MSSKIGVLAHNQPSSAKARTHIPREVARNLLQHMAAERITAKLIRMFPPGSLFVVLRPAGRSAAYIPEKLPPLEVPGVHFVEPQSATWREQHRRVALDSSPA